MAVVYPSGTLQRLPISEEFLRGLVFQSLNATRYTPITALIGFRDECAVSIGQFCILLCQIVRRNAAGLLHIGGYGEVNSLDLDELA